MGPSAIRFLGLTLLVGVPTLFVVLGFRFFLRLDQVAWAHLLKVFPPRPLDEIQQFFEDDQVFALQGGLLGFGYRAYRSIRYRAAIGHAYLHISPAEALTQAEQASSTTGFLAVPLGSVRPTAKPDRFLIEASPVFDLWLAPASADALLRRLGSLDAPPRG